MFQRILNHLRGHPPGPLHSAFLRTYPPLDNAEVISLAADFSPTPSGVSDADGPYNATRFLESHLLPALEKNDAVIVDLEGLAACAASFLEGAFAPLVTKHHYSPDYLRKHLQIRPDNTMLHDDTAALAFHYIDHAGVPAPSSPNTA